jgi:hypothetical protein
MAGRDPILCAPPARADRHLIKRLNRGAIPTIADQGARVRTFERSSVWRRARKGSISGNCSRSVSGATCPPHHGCRCGADGQGSRSLATCEASTSALPGLAVCPSLLVTLPFSTTMPTGHPLEPRSSKPGRSTFQWRMGVLHTWKVIPPRLSGHGSRQ